MLVAHQVGFSGLPSPQVGEWTSYFIVEGYVFYRPQNKIWYLPSYMFKRLSIVFPLAGCVNASFIVLSTLLCPPMLCHVKNRDRVTRP
jgi:hypothetical protein